MSKYYKGNKYLLCAIDLFSKDAWVVPIKYEKGTSIVNAFQKIISEGRKPNKIWVDQVGEVWNNCFKDFLKIDNIEMYSTYNEENLLLLRDLSANWKARFLSIWQLFQKMFMLMC